MDRNPLQMPEEKRIETNQQALQHWETLKKTFKTN